MKKRTKLGQVWIETVLYTLIAFVMIGLVLAYAKPKIEEIQDKSVIDQSVEILEKLENIISSGEMTASGNQRVVKITIKKGTMRINAIEDTITFEIESDYEYTEHGEDINIGNILANTQEVGSGYEIDLASDYSENYNLTYRGKDEIKIINKASASYSLVISNEGTSGGKIVIDFDI